EVTVVHQGDFVGVTAPNEQLAAKALAALRPEWQTTPQSSSAELFTLLKKPSSEGRDSGPPQGQGSVAEGLASAQKKLSATYTVAYIAHAPLEPRAAVAEWNGDKLTVWTGTQRPFGVRGELAGALKVPEEKIRVIVPD